MSKHRSSGLKYKDCRRILLDNGFLEVRSSSTSHVVFKRNSGETAVLSACGVNKMIWRRYTKEFGLKV